MFGTKATGVMAAFMSAMCCLVFLSGCGNSHECTPKNLNLSTTTATTGDIVTLSAPAADCVLPTDARNYTIVMNSANQSFTLGTVAAAPSGTFSKDFTVPWNALNDTYTIEIKGGLKNLCDTKGSPCAYRTKITVEKSSYTKVDMNKVR